MTTRLLAGATLLVSFSACADTLIMKDGTRLRGTFNNANTTQMTFTESNGSRRDVSIYDVQELRFGNDDQYSPNNRNSDRGSLSGSSGANGNYRDQSVSNSALGDDLDRLQQDLRSAMDNNRLSPEQTQSLEDARQTLRSASQQSRNGRSVNQRSVRLALDSIRNTADRMERLDRDRLLESVRRVNASMGTQQGRDY